jgi:energy-coupling factor transporter ATP-binding protein EcfA2
VSDVTYLGQTDFRNQHQPFGIRDTDRLQHLYCIGKTGTGKSTLLLNMAISDIHRGNGLCVIDPHGELSIRLLDYVPKHRIKDVIYFNPADTAPPIPFNPLSGIAPFNHHLAVSGIIGTLKRIWVDNWGPRLEHILRHSLLTLLEWGEATLLHIQPLLTNELFRSKVLEKIRSNHILQFWKGEFDRYSPALRAEAIAPILNKLGLFNASLVFQATVGQRYNTWNVAEVMSKKQILLVNLSKGAIGEDASMLLGSMLVSAIQLAAMERGTLPEAQRTPFYLYIDEAHSFLSHAVIDILSESRKFGLSLFLTHQYLAQMPEKITEALFGNVGTLLSFRVGASDAEALAREFYPVFKEDDLINLPKYHLYLKLLVDGQTSRPFSAITMPLPKTGHSFAQDIITYSKKVYGMSTDEGAGDTVLHSINTVEMRTLFED